METSAYVQIILGTLGLLLIYASYRIVPKNVSRSKKIRAPEPAGTWPLLGHLHLLGRPEPACKILGAFADKCGPIYTLRLGARQVLVVSCWEMVKECFATNDRVLASRANVAAGKHMGYNNALFALAPYGQYWRDVRKLATVHLLSNHRLDLLKHVRTSEVDTFIKELHSLCSEPAEWSTRVTISKLLEALTFNISLRLVVGKRFDSDIHHEENSEPWRYRNALEDALYLFGLFVVSDALPWLEWMDIRGHISAMKRTAKELDAVIEHWLEEHMIKRRSDGERSLESDFMDVMLSNLGEGATVSGHSRDDVIKSTALLLTLTGSGSTSMTITWVLCLLLNNPKVLKTAQEEVDIHVGKGRWVEESDLHKLNYLQAIVKETLRLYPPGPITGIREATEDCYIGSYYVQKGTRLLVNLWKLHRDPRIWENPSEFKPERFLTTHADVDFKGQNFEYIPFGSGRRACPAINLGVQVVHLTLARLLQAFDFKTVNGLPVDMKEGVGLGLPKLNPLDVLIQPRLALKLYQHL